ncbi:hypothetical protein [Ferrimonas balearica]|uniref:hypothetical protein n=1 Tax=Ferrimonas balearica TaxID=44012 RepID=UPI001C9639A7|nr:hypothetical protein [Ferrimonas balearica]MBY6226101.1 hypothetical protein [Ferrimonas balearica]
MTVPPVPDLLTWLHLGIALIGSFNCLLLAILLLYFYRDPLRSERYLASWLALLALYFGLMPNLLPPAMLLPAYALQFFALPCLYLYLCAQLRQRKVKTEQHLLLPALLFLYALITALLHDGHHLWSHMDAEGLLLILLPVGAIAQYLYYAGATWLLWRRWAHPGATASARPNTPRYSWLMVLMITSGLVWLLRLIGVAVPLWTGQPIPAWMLVSKRITIVSLLLFGLAYGLSQITASAWGLRRQARTNSDARRQPPESVLSSEELAFLRDLNKKR